ncbi:hypothetical protein FBUS_04920 [Fasciolopsis buskii]|uniref:Uncharacterized protein n=1 Tax=Fasciolopsis buskii TaxID=27845 RepID=A0A8E0RM05_9TREM|nr:hypothetical protein FBUS_04920 [Fasciolopsis buski]
MDKGDVQSVISFDQEGASLAFLSFADESKRLKLAITANIWNICQRYLEDIETDMFQEIMLVCTQGRLIICRFASVLVCLHGSKEVELGVSRAKPKALLRNSEGPLYILAASKAL